ncbi:MAG TPA: PDZ domain-containing protein, partial [Terricaulis sp.]|nr:PDZ domain-containing protein [Terricaulis sp.]
GPELPIALGEGGAVVTRITPNGPAQRAGLRPGDVVIRFAGRDVADSRALTRMVGESAVGALVEIEIVREGRRMALSANIERLIEAEGGARIASGGTAEDFRRDDGGPRSGRIFGVALSELDASLREEFQIEPLVQGLVVLGVDVASANSGALRAGDVIEAMAFEPIDSMSVARSIAGRAAIGEHAIVVRINRDGAVTYRRLRARA